MKSGGKWGKSGEKQAGTTKESERVRKESPGAGPPESRKSAPQSLKRVRRSGFRLFSDSFETLRGALFRVSRGPGPGGSFRTLCAGPGRSARGGADHKQTVCPSIRRTQEGCGGLRGKNPGAFPKAGPIFQHPCSLPNLDRHSMSCCSVSGLKP